jgi:hypothetical protein
MGTVLVLISFTLRGILFTLFILVYHFKMLSFGVLPLISSYAAAVTTSPSKSCAKALTCGSHGYNKTTNAYNYLSDASLANQAACSAKCSSDSCCISHAFGSGACLLYPVQVASNLNTVPSNSFVFDDCSCSAAVSLTTSTTSSTTSTS